MCQQFALLLAKTLVKLGYSSTAVAGEATYFNNGQKVFVWAHTWVRAGNEVIDGNVDILFENPVIPPTVSVRPYWGPVTAVPGDRHLRQDHSIQVPQDTDVDNIWWPELEVWLSKKKL
jgi:hypothetical protein